MIENTGGIGNPFEFTKYEMVNATGMDESQEVAKDSSDNLGLKSQQEVEKDTLDWQPGSKIKQNKIKNSLKTQIEESRKRLINNREARDNETKKNKFIGKVTYEFESYPSVDTNFDEIV